MGCCRDRNDFDDFRYRDNYYYDYPNGYRYNYPDGYDNRCRRHREDIVVDVHVEVPEHHRYY